LILFSPKLGNFSSERFFQTSFPFIFPDVLVDLGLTVVISEFMKRQGNERALRECLQRLPACFHETDQVAPVLLFGMQPLIENERFQRRQGLPPQFRIGNRCGFCCPRGHAAVDKGADLKKNPGSHHNQGLRNIHGSLFLPLWYWSKKSTEIF